MKTVYVITNRDETHFSFKFMFLLKFSQVQYEILSSNEYLAIRNCKINKDNLTILDFTSIPVTFLEEIIEESTIAVILPDDNKELINDCMQFNTKGYFLETMPYEELTNGIHQLLEENVFIAPKVLPFFVESVKVNNSKKPANLLTIREWEVLERLAKLESSHEIAKAMYLSEKTIASYIQKIIQKLGARDRLAAVLMALKESWITL